LHWEILQLVARERVESLRREADRHRLVREASIRSPQHPARAPGRTARALRRRGLTGGGAVWLGRVTRRYAARGWRTDLPRVVLLLQAGNAFSWFGYGLILPFEIVYLHQFRGFSTATAGLVLAAILGAGTLVTLPSGALLDRFRAKPILIAANLASALGYAGLAFVDRPWQAFAWAVIGGAGVGVTRTANQTLLITLIAPEQRVASFALGRAAQNLGLGLGAVVAGFVVSSAYDLRSFQALYLFDAVTYLALALVVLAAVPDRRAATVDRGMGGGGFRAVARDRRFLIVIAVNFALIVVGYALFANILAPFVKAHTRVGPGGIGILFLFNTFFVAIAQVPATHLFKRMHRARIFATASGLFAIALLGVLPATLIHSELAAAALLCGVATVIGIGECVHSLVLSPLVADLAPPHLLGRYISVFSLMVTGGFAIGPAIGGAVLAYSPNAVWWGGALVAGVIGAGALLAGDRIPDKPLAATESTAPPSAPIPDAA
jgi:MFS family permease